eukprot:5145609-Pyramimonas_sp.AAC.1
MLCVALSPAFPDASTSPRRHSCRELHADDVGFVLHGLAIRHVISRSTANACIIIGAAFLILDSASLRTRIS